MADPDLQLGRVLLEVCRHTYATGAGGAANAADLADADGWISRLAPSSSLGALHESVSFQGQSDGDTSKACVLRFERANVVSFMGTEAEFSLRDREKLRLSLRDWLQDGRAKPVPFVLPAAVTGGRTLQLPGLVHHGFLNELSAVLHPVLRQLESWKGTTRPLVITGHSQGAAEAGLAVPVFAALGYQIQSAWTFAAPRAGNAEFVRAAESSGVPIERLEFGDDIVPHMPPVALRHALQTMSDQIPLLWKPVALLLGELLEGLHDYGYQTLGRLTWGHQSDRIVRVGISRANETAVFGERLKKLLRGVENWGAHHHLYGPETALSQPRGGYTALVSPEQCGWTVRQG